MAHTGLAPETSIMTQERSCLLTGRVVSRAFKAQHSKACRTPATTCSMVVMVHIMLHTTGSVVQHRLGTGRPTLLNMKIFPSDSSRCCSSPYLYLVTSSRSCSNQQVVLTQTGRCSSGAQEQPNLTEHGSLCNKYSAESKW